MNEYTMPRDTDYQSPYETAYAGDETSKLQRECDAAMEAAGQQASELLRSARQTFVRFAREQPEVTALCCLGVGFILGWKLKPW